MWSEIILAAREAGSFLPRASTKSPSGSGKRSAEFIDLSCSEPLTHQIKIYAVVDQVVLARLDVCRRGKVDPVLLANVLNVFVCASQTDNVWVELLQVGLQDGGSVAGRIAGDENGAQRVARRFLDLVNHLGHLVQFLGANVGTVAEAKVHLRASRQLRRLPCSFSARKPTNAYFPFMSSLVNFLPF